MEYTIILNRDAATEIESVSDILTDDIGRVKT